MARAYQRSARARKQATASSKDVSHATCCDNQRSKRQHLAVKSPLKIGQIGVEILAERNERYINCGDIGIQDREHDSDHEKS